MGLVVRARTEVYAVLGRSLHRQGGNAQDLCMCSVEAVDSRRQKPGRDVFRAGLKAHPELK